MRSISLVVSVAMLALAGCASNDGLVATQAPTVVASTNTQITPQSKLICHKETKTGTTMITSVCETEQSVADRQALQNTLNNNAGSMNAVNHQGIGH